MAVTPQLEATPALVSLDFTPKSVDVSDAPKVITVTAHLTAESGIEDGGFGFDSPSLLVQDAWVTFNAANRISGDANDGVYVADVVIPKDAEAGDWTVDAWFEVGFTVYRYSDRIEGAFGIPAGSPGILEVVSATPDAQPPELVSFDFDPRVIDISNGPKPVTVTARIRDIHSGFTTGAFFFSDEQGYYAVGSFGPDNRVAGNAQDGIYVTTLTVPHVGEVTWILNGMSSARGR